MEIIMKNMTLERITEVCDGVYYGSETDKTKEITGAVIDSRQVEPGYLFIAVKGEKVDGHRFIPQVFEKGALAVLSEQELSDPAGPYIRVESTLGAMKILQENSRYQSCRHYRKCWKNKHKRDDRIGSFPEI